MDRRVLLISLSRALNIRNFLLYDFYDKALAAFDEVHILSDFSKQDAFRKQFERPRVVFHAIPTLKRSVAGRIRRRLLWYFTLARFRWFYKLPYTSMFIKGKRFNWFARPRVTRGIVRFLEWCWTIRLWHGAAERVRRWLLSPREFRNLLRAVRPTVVMTSYLPHDGELAEEFLIGSARQERIPVVAHISGVDNLTLKSPFLAVPDYVLVWNHLMREHAESIYPALRGGRAMIAPPPQFAVYGDKDKLLDRNGLLDVLEFPESLRSRQLVTFISNGGVNYLNPRDELDIFERLYQRIQESVWRDQVVFFIRLSATRNEDQWGERLKYMPQARTRAVTMAHSNCRADTAWESEPLDPIFLQSLIRHSSVLISASSTLTLDACLCDVPCVCVAFDGFSKPNSIIDSMIRKPIEDHFLPLTLMGAARFALSEDDLFEHVTTSLQDPAKDAAARAKARRYYFADLIGKPHEDEVDCLLRAGRIASVAPSPHEPLSLR